MFTCVLLVAGVERSPQSNVLTRCRSHTTATNEPPWLGASWWQRNTDTRQETKGDAGGGDVSDTTGDTCDTQSTGAAPEGRG